MNSALNYRICTRCVMDTSASDIVFDNKGQCSYCTEFLARVAHHEAEHRTGTEETLQAFVSKLKARGRGRHYDCIIGVSGGVDSSWVLVKAIEMGLRPLAVHMDNGWNSELAQNNIANLINGLGVDLHTHVIDWTEYRKLMQAFFDADVLDIELLYDNAMLAVNYAAALKHRVKYILSGDNMATEGMRMPPGWNWLKFDKKNIVGLGRRGGVPSLNTFPAVGTLGFFMYRYVLGIRWVPFLDKMDYNKFDALAHLEQKFGYKRYPYKHYESVFTRFYQGYILPMKFGVDKRRLHLATLVASGQLTREEAISQLQGIPYQSTKDRDEDVQYFLKKMGWSKAQLDEYLARPERKHTAYPSEKALWDLAKRMHSVIGAS